MCLLLQLGHGTGPPRAVFDFSSFCSFLPHVGILPSLHMKDHLCTHTIIALFPSSIFDLPISSLNCFQESSATNSLWLGVFEPLPSPCISLLRIMSRFLSFENVHFMHFAINIKHHIINSTLIFLSTFISFILSFFFKTCFFYCLKTHFL